MSDVFCNNAQAVAAIESFGRWGSFQATLDDDTSLLAIPHKDLLPVQKTSHSIRLMIAKEGSQTYAWAKMDVFREYAFPEAGLSPLVPGWLYGEGYTWSLPGFSMSTRGMAWFV